jgi:hypothetical protein
MLSRKLQHNKEVLWRILQFLVSLLHRLLVYRVNPHKVKSTSRLPFRLSLNLHRVRLKRLLLHPRMVLRARNQSGKQRRRPVFHGLV